MGTEVTGLPPLVIKTTGDSGGIPEKKAKFRQPVGFNDNASNNFTMLPTNSNGVFLNGNGVWQGVLLDKKHVDGSEINVKVVGKAAVYSDKVGGAGASGEFYASTPNLNLGKSRLYGQLAGTLNYMGFFGNSSGYSLNVDANSAGIYCDNIDLGSKVKFSPSFQAYGSWKWMGTGADNYNTLMGTKDLIDASGLYRLNCRFDFLDLANKLTGKANFYWKFGQTAGNPDKISHILGFNFDNCLYGEDKGLGTKVGVELWPKAGTPILDILIDQQIFKPENGGYVSFDFALKNAMDQSYRAYQIGLTAHLNAIPFLGGLVDINGRITWGFGGGDTRNETKPGIWDKKEEPITNWDYDPTRPTQLTHDIEYKTSLAAVDKGQKLKMKIGSNNDNGEPGIIGKDHDGNPIPGHVDVKICSIRVFDIFTDPDNPKELNIDLSGLVGMPLTDLGSGGRVVDLPIIGPDNKYLVKIQLETNGTDLNNTFPPPDTTSCQVKLEFVREQ